MYTSDKKQRITLRLNERQFNFVQQTSETLGVSPSDFLRMVINTALASAEAANKATARAFEDFKEGVGRENDKADINDKL